jgi:L-iditol 2-dehydrogenase
MRALVYTGIKSFEVREVDLPVLGDGDVLIEIKACGICGSDIHAFLGHDERRPAPLILGHEVAGIVVDANNTKWNKGDRVTVNPLVTCGECTACKNEQGNLCPNRQIISMLPRQGGFAQFLKMPAGNLIQVPEETSFEKAALAEPIACGWHAARLGLEKSSIAIKAALVLGGGAIGVGTALSLKAQGITNVTICETNPLRIKNLEKIGFNVSAPDDIEDSAFEMVIDGAGFSATRKMACEKVTPGGIILHIGLGDNIEGLDVRRLTLQEIMFVGTYTYTKKDFEQTANAIFSGQLGALDWLDVRRLEDGEQAFNDILSGIVAAPKIILTP